MVERSDPERPDLWGAVGWAILRVLTYCALAMTFVGAGALLWILFGDSGSSD